MAEHKPTAIRKPLVLHDHNAEGITQLIDHIAVGDYADFLSLAAAEANRLSPYFTALEKRLTSPGDLTAIFQRVAAETHNALLSEFIVLPETVMKDKIITDLERTQKLRPYLFPVTHGDYKIHLGFIQVTNADQSGSVTFPVATFDEKIMRMTRDYPVQPMLEGLQDILTIANHDMLHHLTNAYLTPDISKSMPVPYTDELTAFFTNYAGTTQSRSNHYESWALISHANTWRELQSTGAEKSFIKTIDQFFDDLQNIDNTMKINGKSHAERTSVIDYFSVYACFALMRIYSLDSPVMQHALHRAESINPDPAQTFADFAACTALSGRAAEDPVLRRELNTIFQDLLKSGHLTPEHDAGRLSNLLICYNDVTPHCGGDQIDTYALQQYVYGCADKDDLVPDIKLTMQEFSNGLSDNLHKPEALRLAKEVALTTLQYLGGDTLLRERHQDVIIRACEASIKYIKEKQDNDLIASPTLNQVLKNYDSAGITLAAADAGATSFRLLKLIQMINLTPQIALLQSPDRHSADLRNLRRDVLAIDRGVHDILSGRHPA